MLNCKRYKHNILRARSLRNLDIIIVGPRQSASKSNSCIIPSPARRVEVASQTDAICNASTT